MSAMPTEPEPDYGLCQQVLAAVEKINELDPPKPDWMSGEFANMLHHQMSASYTFIHMNMLKAGHAPEEAKELAQMQAPLLAFELGRRVGIEMESARAMRELFGE